MFNLKGKNCVIAGGCGLIGKAIVAGLRRYEGNVQTVDIADGFDIHGDICSHEVIKRLIENRIHIFVNCIYPKTITDHIWGFLGSSEVIAKDMAKHGGGSIINFASIYGVVGPDDSVYEGTDMTMPLTYAGAKGFIIAMTRTIATRYGKYGVRANCISPGGVLDKQPQEFVDRYCRRVPLGRMANPDDIVGAVLLLASDAGKYITGQNLIIDGGLIAW